MFIDREEIFPEWFLGGLDVLKIIEQHKICHSKLSDEHPPYEKYCKWKTIYRITAGSGLMKLYIGMILNHYSNGLYSGRLHNIPQDKNSRDIWLFYRLSELDNDDNLHKFSQKIIDDIIKCPFEIDWNFPIKDPYWSDDWTKDRMCTHIAQSFINK